MMKLNLKFKILITVLLLLTIATGTNIYYSTKTFVDDKKAYLFDSLLSKSEIIADRINDEISAIEQFSLDIFLKSESPKNSSFLVSFTLDNDFQFKNVTQINLKSPYYREDLILNLKDNLKELINSANLNKNSRIEPLKFKNETFWVKVDQNTLGYSLHFFTHQKIESLLKNDNLTESQLFWNSTTGSRYFLTGQTLLQNSAFFDLLKSKINKQTKEVTAQKKSYLASINKSKLHPFIIIIGIEKSKAFQVTKDMAIKTILFALFLLGIFAVFGILLASQLTTPILELTHAAKNVSEGNYDYKESIKTQDELKLLGVAFEKMCFEIKELLGVKEQMISELASANEKLDEYNKNLEVMVQDRTLKLNEANTFMSAMINSLDQGLVVFDSELKIKPIFTKASETLFRQNPNENTFIQLLNKNEEEGHTLSQWAQITFNGVIPFDSAVGLAPDHISFGKGIEEEGYQYISLNYYPMLNSDDPDKLDNIVAVATDKTSSLISEFQFKKQEAYVQMVLKILKNKSAFSSFCEEVNRIFDNFKNCYNEDENSINADLAMMLFHTLNGGFGMFRFFELREEARNNEQFIIDNKERLTNEFEYISSFAQELGIRSKRLQELFIEKVRQIDNDLGTQFLSKKSSREIEESKIEQYYQNLLVFRDELQTRSELKDALNGQINEYEEIFIKKSICDFLEPYEELCLKTAERLDKKIAPLKYINGDLKLHPAIYLEFFNVLVHLFRNCLDHGLEFPQERIELGKNEYGVITISTQEKTDGRIIITISDDGKGINPIKVRNKVKELLPEYDIDNESDQEIVYHIFDPFFSTKDEVTELSGRGVGMSAIKEVVDRMQGTIKIESHLNIGTKFIFEFRN